MVEDNFDAKIKNILSAKAQEVKFNAELFDKIESGIQENNHSFSRVFSDRFRKGFMGQILFNSKKIIVTSACSIIFLAFFSILAFPAVRTWAFSNILNIKYTFVKDGKGYKTEKVTDRQLRSFYEHAEQRKAEKQKYGKPEVSFCKTAAEARKKVGFPIILPSYLPKNACMQLIIAARYKNYAEKNYSIINYTKDTAADSEEIFQLRINYPLRLGPEDNKISINNKTAFWIEYPIPDYDNKNITPEEMNNTPPSRILTGHCLNWKIYGISYQLVVGLMQQDEAMRIASSIKVQN
ncbi:MAG TPA: hypothetical protein VHT34_09805 [Clostridia bacterium]|nr:hypothetical protein [Clostridia bacterium]